MSDRSSQTPPTRPSGYLSSLVGNPVPARKPVTINIDNPLNPAQAWPAFHIGVDAKKEPEKSNIGVRMAKLDALNSASLVASALTPTHRYGPSTTAARRTQEAAARAATDFTSKSSTIDAAPGRTGSAAKRSKTAPKSIGKSKKAIDKPAAQPSSPLSIYDDTDFSPRTRRRAALVGEKKRKREGGSEDEYEDDDDEVDDVEEEDGEEGMDKDDDIGIQTRTKKRGPLAKTSRTSTGTDILSQAGSAVSAKESETSPPVSKILRKKDPGKAVPKNMEEAGEADTMMREWRHSGKTWKDIYVEWERITGKRPGKSSLSVRWIKLCDNVMASGGADDMMLLKYRETVLTDMEPEIWQRVATKIGNDYEATFSAESLRKRYNALKTHGFRVGQNLPDEDEQDDMAKNTDPRLLHNDSFARSITNPFNVVVNGTGNIAQTDTFMDSNISRSQSLLYDDAEDRFEAVVGSVAKDYGAAVSSVNDGRINDGNDMQEVDAGGLVDYDSDVDMAGAGGLVDYASD